MIKHFETGKIFLSEFNLDSCLNRYSEFKTQEEALKSKKIKILSLTKCYGEDLILTWMKAWLISLSSYMDFQITPQQVNITSRNLVEELYMLNLSEITLFFNRIIKGKYGEFYGKFNGQTILRSALEYRSQRGKILSGLTESEQFEIQK